MTPRDVVDRIVQDSPLFHFIDESEIGEAGESARRAGVTLKAGAQSWGVPREVMDYLATTVQPHHLTIETGCGVSTVILAAAARHHICVTPSRREVERVKTYLEQIGISTATLTCITESSDHALPRLTLDQKLDFALIDGCHGYPLAALDWHYIDNLLRVGGLIAFDNTEIRAVREHCRFLDQNGTYRLTDSFSFSSGPYGMNVYEKLADQPREWIFQAYCRDVAAYEHPAVPFRHRRV